MLKAVLLAPGPACMVEVLGRSLLETALESLERVGIEEAVLVVGHRAESVRGAFGDRVGRVKLTYVENPDHACTSGVYSLWLARRELDADVLLLQADLLLDHAIVQELVLGEGDVAVVDCDHRGTWRLVNAYRLTRATLAATVLPALDHHLLTKGTASDIEALFADLELALLRTGARPWARIATAEDVRRAERLFGERLAPADVLLPARAILP